MLVAIVGLESAQVELAANPVELLNFRCRWRGTLLSRVSLHLDGN